MSDESKLLVQDKEVVVPGQPLAEGMEYLPSFGTYRLGNTIRANQLGLLTIDGKVLKSIPLAGRYLPKRNDVVIGKVIDILMSGWRLDLNSPYSAVLPLKEASFDFIRKDADLTSYFDLEDWVVAKITQVTTQNLIDVTTRGPGLKKLAGGRIIKVNTHKVPRVIGKRGSMVSMIKHATGCQVVVGQNGIIWVNGEPEKEVFAVQAIKKIEREAHTPGLTDRIRGYLEKLTGQKLPEQPMYEEEPAEEQRDDRGADRRGDRDDRRGPPRGDRRGPPRRGPPRSDHRGPPRGDRRGPPRGGRPPRRDNRR